jgi:hypothetical protein
VLQVSAAGAAVYRDVAPLALEFERCLLESLPSADRVALDRLLGLLTQRAETLSLGLRTTVETARARKPRRPPRRRAPG